MAREALALDAALAAARDGITLPLPPPALDEPRLGEPLAPIVTLEELTASLLIRLRPPEASDDAHEQERALAAIARFCGSRAPFDGPLKPVLALAFTKSWPEDPILARRRDHRLGARHDPPARRVRETRSRARLAELADRCAAGRAGPLLAAPTHRGGWIDPLVLVERAAQTTARPELAGSRQRARCGSPPSGARPPWPRPRTSPAPAPTRSAAHWAGPTPTATLPP